MMVSRFTTWVSAGFAATALLAFGISCVTTPVTERKALVGVSDATMNDMGQAAYREILAKERVSTDKELLAVVRRVGERIAAASGVKFDWAFTVIESPTVNAFCLPGGKVAVYTGILPIAKTEGGLAAILGHEVAHATARHGAERMTQGMVAQAGVVLAGATVRDPKHRDLLMAAMGAGLQFGILLPFSRKHESEADTIGLNYMAKAGYDPREAPELWKRMASGAGGGRTPEILSTHPDPERRSRELVDEIDDVEELYEKSEKQPSRKLPGTKD